MSEITRNQAIQIVEDIRTAISAGSVTNTMEAQVLEYCVVVLGRRIEEASQSGSIVNLPDVVAFLAGISSSTTLRELLSDITGKIPSEASSLNQLADKAFVTSLSTALQTAVNTINSAIGNGYVYAGIATLSVTPVSGKVFYLARQGGQYTNFGGLTVTEGINILKRNGSAWSQEQLMSMADIYKNPLIGYYECDTAGNTAAKTVTAAGYVLPTTGGSMKIKMANRNTAANATLNINSTGAKPLYYNGQRAGVGNTWGTNEVIEVFYDGTNYQAYNVAGSNGDGVFDISVYNLTNGQPTPYADLADALGTDGANIPLSLRKGGMSVKFIQGNALNSDNKYVQWRCMAQNFTTDVTQWQGVIDEPISESDDLVKSKGIFEAIKRNPMGFVVDYNHLWNYYDVDDSRNKYQYYTTFDCIWISIPKDAKRVHVDGIPDSGKSYYYFSSYEISNGTQVSFRNYQEAKYRITIKASGADFVPYFEGDNTPILLLINVRKSDLPEGFSYDDIRVWFDYVEDTVNCESSLNGKKISILGDSLSGFSTYTYWMDGDTKKFNNRYPARASYAINNIMSIHQMWWKRLFNKCGAILEVGSCIGSSGISDNRYYEMPSYLDRYADLGNPDVILIQGFHNEPPAVACTFDPTVPIEELYTLDVGQAYDKLIRLLKVTYPGAKIVDILINPFTRFITTVREIDAYYNVEHIECLKKDIDFTTITTDDAHPDSDGMERIADYVIERLANNATHVATEEFVAENTLEENEITYSEEDVAGYITDKRGAIIGKLMKSGAVEWIVKNSRDILFAERIDELDENAIREFEIDDTEENVAAYITDKKKAIIAKINKDGSIDRLVENDRDRHTVHFEDVDIEGIANLLTDKDKKIIASINDKGEVDFYSGGGFAGEKIVEAKTDEYIKLVISKNGFVVGGIKPDGTVKIFKADIENIDDIAPTKELLRSLPLIATGIDNIEVSKSKKMLNLLTSVNSDSPIEIKGSDIALHPCISIIDDDTRDNFIPSSENRQTVGNNPVGGYFSLLLPLLLSLGKKHNKHLVAGMACEGQRVGFTPMNSDADTYTTLNQNGLLVKQLVEHEGWEVLNHSMTARQPFHNLYYGINGINSSEASTILANSTYVGYRAATNTSVLDKLTNKWYQPNSTRTEWVEINGKKYNQMYYQDYTSKTWYINRGFDFEYNWGEWLKRADELGLPYIKQIVHNGGSCTPFSILGSRNYAYCSYHTAGTYNIVPTCAAIKRQHGVYGSTDTNVPSSGWKTTFINYVNECISANGWMPLMVHFYEERYYNGYREGLTYENKDSEYEAGGSKYEWIHPLNESEILSMDTNNYWANPPSRLGISSWDEWIPANGTQLRVLYDVLDYALSNGVEIVSPSAGWEIFGNIIQFGVDRNYQTYQAYTSDLEGQYTDAEQSYLTIGADGSIRYFSK